MADTVNETNDIERVDNRDPFENSSKMPAWERAYIKQEYEIYDGPYGDDDDRKWTDTKNWKPNPNYIDDEEEFKKVFAGGTALTALLGAAEEGDEEALAATQDVGSLKQYLASYYSNLGYTADQIAENVARDTSEYTSAAGGYADGGRIGYAFGDKVEMAAGIEGLPINVNPKGVKELDLRETGGFIPPVGVKEKADDIPAMLSNNEFVFTADAVKAAGGGSVDKGAQIMYDTMKKLESKVV